MKQKNLLFIIFVTLFAVFSCERVDEGQLEGDKSVAEKVQMTFSAVIEKEADTKTVLDGALGDELRKVFWQPGDKVGVSAQKSDTWIDVCEFVSDLTSVSESSEFSGSAEFSSTYKAFYPYQSTLKDSCNVFIFNMPSEQKFVMNSFDPAAAPMVAYASSGEKFNFRNVCGVLALQLKGEQAVKSILFKPINDSGSIQFVAGDFEVAPITEGTPEIKFHGNGSQSVTLTCETPVELNTETATAFYMVLPPATYERFYIYITTESGEVMIKEGTNPLTVKRADVVATGALTYVETLPINLSEHGDANCYIVNGSGLYSFDGGIIGNGKYGIIAGAGFHTEDPSITPSSAEILWQDRKGVIEGVTYDAANKKINFFATGVEGNALVAAKDADGNILWSWHIWATDQPAEHHYNDYYTGQTGYTVMDRYLGAIRADRGEDEQWRDASGLAYQWGRKDPFVYDNYKGQTYFTTVSQMVPLSEAIANPTVFYGVGYYLWNDVANNNLWKSTQKTIYDPCPVGYMVPSREVWRVFSKNGSDWTNSVDQMNVMDAYDYGYYFIYDGKSAMAYYPANYMINHNAGVEFPDCHAQLWSADTNDDNTAYYYRHYHYTYVDSWLTISERGNKSSAMGIRCVKDENHVDIAYVLPEITGITDITSESATINMSIAESYLSEVTERGIVWGTESGLTIENGNVVTESSGQKDYSVYLTGLQHSTRYYVKAYATNERGTGYSKEMSFYTPFSGDAVDLSADGTANCYIVPPVFSEYSFDASVKGNSKESVGQITSVEVLWETRNTNSTINAGSVIASVELKGNKVHFQLPFDVKPGNALIAVKDALGTILWSWHIWVVDFDPVETQQTYKSGAVMMDRNLGATSVVPVYGGAENTDYSAFGLYYQWGRKDPLPFLGTLVPQEVFKVYENNYPSDANTIEYATQNPTVVYDDVNWNWDNTLWASSKTKYDPCPPGWRVPDMAVWSEWDNAKTGNDDYTIWYSLVQSPYSSPDAYYPLGGDLDWSSTYPGSMYDMGYYRSTDSGYVLTAYRTYMYLWNTIDISRKALVRCMKDMSGQTGSGNDYVVDDEFVWE